MPLVSTGTMTPGPTTVISRRLIGPIREARSRGLYCPRSDSNKNFLKELERGHKARGYDVIPHSGLLGTPHNRDEWGRIAFPLWKRVVAGFTPALNFH